MYTYIYTYMCNYRCKCMLIYTTHKCMYKGTLICKYTHKCTLTCIFTQKCELTCRCRLKYTYTLIYVSINTHKVYAYIYVYIHTKICTHTHTRACARARTHTHMFPVSWLKYPIYQFGVSLGNDIKNILLHTQCRIEGFFLEWFVKNSLKVLMEASLVVLWGIFLARNYVLFEENSLV